MRRKFRPDMDSAERQSEARDWAAERAVPVQAALETVGLLKPGTLIPKLPPTILADAERRAKLATAPMGALAISP